MCMCVHLRTFDTSNVNFHLSKKYRISGRKFQIVSVISTAQLTDVYLYLIVYLRKPTDL